VTTKRTVTLLARVALLSLLAALVVSLGGSASAQQGGDPLAAGFRTPPESAKPRTWWHWTMSNVTKEGITKDLEWMKRTGIGGFMLADVNSGGGQTVEPKVPFGTPEWFDAVRHAAAEADRLGLEMSIFSSPGWSETGGPWVKPDEAMKKLVWSETTIVGPKKFSGKLPDPPRNNGQIRDTGATSYPQGGGDPTYYGDSAVVAYRPPAGELDAAAANPIVTTSHGPVDGTALLDDQLNTWLTIPAPKDGGPAWVQFDFPKPFTARAITIGGRGGSANGIPIGRVLASGDGRTFRTLVTLPGTQLYRQGMVRTFTFAPTTATCYRIELTGAPLSPAQTMSQAPPQPAAEYVLSEAILHGGARVHRWEEKAGFSFLFDYEHVPTPAVPAAAAVPAREVIDLTSKMRPDGTLEWDAPAGTWTVLRLGCSLTGAKNRPATPTGSGFEADKLSREHMESYVHGYFDPLREALGPLFGKSLRYVMMDSWEAGTNNWTDRMIGEFTTRRGYDPTRFLPVLTGRVVDSAEVSDRFTWDFRRTLADMWADNHYGTMADLLRAQGIGIYAEAAGVSLEMPEDTLLNKSKVEIPMGEFWVRDLHPRLMYLQDVRGAASASHVYGKGLTATESFTGGGYESPFTLKKVADYWFSQGTNRLVFHTSAHQPLDTKPGNTMVGTHINRNITWAELAVPFMTYLARASYMLQQGLFVADLAYLLNEGAPSTPPIWGPGTLPPPPDGHDYDFVNADVLLDRMAVGADGRLTLPDGMSYRVLVLPDTDRMRPELLRKIKDLVTGGAIIVGRGPTASPSLADYPAADEEVRALAAEIWGDLDGSGRSVRRVGKGAVYWGWPLERVLEMEKVAKDFDFARPLDCDVAWLHRRVKGAAPADDADIYYVANLTDRSQTFDARFRVAGRQVEIWRPDTGAIEPAGYAIAGEQTTVPMRLTERESAFVVFRRPAAALARTTAHGDVTTLASIDGAWDVAFPPDLGAPPRARLPTLASLTASADEGVKFFSGTATYTKTIQASRDWFSPDRAVVLDLGPVGDIAEVTVNGRALGQLWKAPYRIDVSAALRPGDNRLEIKVTNEWTNRIAGDRLLPADRRILVQPVPDRRTAGGPPALPESGLVGPVTIQSQPVNRVVDSADGSVANIPVNNTEATAGRYTLPDPLKTSNGRPVRDAQTWLTQRRPELVRLFEEHQYGRAPGRPADMSFDVFDRNTPAFGGSAIRRQVSISFTKDKSGPKLDVLMYLPAAATGPVPLLLNIGFTANNLTVDDPGVKVGAVWNPQQQRRVPATGERRGGGLNVLAAIDRGLAVATFNYADVDPDAPGATAHGVRQLHLKPGQNEPAPNEWGTIAAWAWGISRVVDYLETDRDVDAQRIAITGVSRLGKTVMWAGASDPRISAVIASCSGEGGAALSRRNYGETIAHLVAPTRYPYQFAANYAKLAGDPGSSPIDANLLVALIAPRALLLQTGDTDTWSDPKGEFLAALSARPVFELFGRHGPATDGFAPAGQIVGDTLAYYMHAGGHGMAPGDWAVYLDFLEKQFTPGR
jgi:hypothetical protein